MSSSADPRAAALDARSAGAALSSALGWPPARCSVLDAKIESGSTSVLYQLGDRLVVAGHRDGAPPTGGAEVAALGLRAWVFPDDPALPALARVLSPDGMAAALRSALPGDGEVVRRCRVELVRYRPGRRATLRVNAWVSPSGGGRPVHCTYFAKIYHDAKKAAAVREVMGRLASAEQVRAGRVRIPPVAAFLPEVPMIVLAPVAGTPLDLLLGPLRDGAVVPDSRARPGVVAAAGALAAVHEIAPSAGKHRSAQREAARMLGRAEAVATVNPAVGEAMAEVARLLLVEVADLPEVVTGVHGDCKPSQFLVGGTAPAVLDFDHAGPGDPAADAGGFAASLEQLAIWQSLTSRETAAAAARTAWLAGMRLEFLDEYVRRAPDWPATSRRLVYQEAAALLRKSLRSFARSPRSPMPAALTAAARARLSPRTEVSS